MKAIQFYKIAAELGHVEAQNRLSNIYERRQGGLVVDERKAAHDYGRAAPQGNTDAKHNHDRMAAKGERDPIKHERKSSKERYNLALAFLLLAMIVFVISEVARLK